jgi:spermidine synthase
VYDFVLSSPPASFDLIVVDVFVDLYVPEKLQEEKFIAALSKLLSQNGILFYNFIARDDKTRDAGGKLYKFLSSFVGKTEWIRLFAKSTENWVFVCDRQA